MLWYWMAAGIAFWAVCGFLAYGRTLAYWQRRWPECAKQGRDGDRKDAMVVAMGGPVGALVALILYNGHGFMWRLPPEELE